MSSKAEPVVILRSGKKKTEWIETSVAMHETYDITGWKAVGTKIAADDLKEIAPVQPASEQGETPLLF